MHSEEPSRFHAEDATVLIGIEDVAKRLSCSTRHIRRLVDRGAMPAPIRLGVLLRWNPRVIDAWIDAGCPSRQSEGLG